MIAFPIDWREAMALSQMADSIGFDSLWTGDHLRHPRDPTVGSLDGWSLLAGWAASTERVHVGMLVSNLIYRHPVVLARETVAVDHISNGRVEVGLGTGVFETDHAMAGVPVWSAGERVARLGEAAEIMDGLLRGELESFEGRFYHFEQAVMAPLPVQRPRPPIVIGATKPKTIRITARWADTWNTFGGFGLDLGQLNEAILAQIDEVNRQCEALGRDPASLQRSLLAYPPHDPWASDRAFEELVSTYDRLGFDEVIVYAPLPHQQAAFERITTTLLPALR